MFPPENKTADITACRYRSVLCRFLCRLFLSVMLDDRLAGAVYTVGGDRDLAYRFVAGRGEHDVAQSSFNDGAQTSRTRVTLDGLLRDGAERVLIELKVDVVSVEQVLVLLDERVLRLVKYTHQSVLEIGRASCRERV